jgi:DnaJ-class molecular chaperone
MNENYLKLCCVPCDGTGTKRHKKTPHTQPCENCGGTGVGLNDNQLRRYRLETLRRFALAERFYGY